MNFTDKEKESVINLLNRFDGTNDAKQFIEKHPIYTDGTIKDICIFIFQICFEYDDIDSIKKLMESTKEHWQTKHFSFMMPLIIESCAGDDDGEYPEDESLKELLIYLLYFSIDYGKEDIFKYFLDEFIQVLKKNAQHFLQHVIQQHSERLFYRIDKKCPKHKSFNKILLDYTAKSNEMIDVFKLLLLKGTSPDQSTYERASEDAHSILKYKPGRANTLPTIYQYCRQSDSNQAGRFALLHDYEDTSSEESSDDEYEPTTLETLTQLFPPDQLIDQESANNRYQHDKILVQKFNKSHKNQQSSTDNPANADTHATMRDYYAAGMKTFLFRGLHRGPGYYIHICCIDTKNDVLKQECHKVAQEIRERTNQNKQIILLNNRVKAQDTQTSELEKWDFCYVSNDDIYHYDVKIFKESGIEEILAHKNYISLTDDEKKAIKSNLSKHFHRVAKNSLNSAHTKMTYSTDVLKNLSELRKPMHISYDEWETTHDLTDQDIYQSIKASANKFSTLVHEESMQYDSRYLELLDKYVKHYKDLFGVGKTIEHYGFSDNPFISTALLIKKAYLYCTGRRINDLHRRDPHYRLFTGKPKHRFAGYIRVYLMEHAYFETHARYIPGKSQEQSTRTDLTPIKKLRLGRVGSFDSEVCFETMIPKNYFYRDIPIYLPNISGQVLNEYRKVRNHIFIERSNVYKFINEAIIDPTASNIGKKDNDSTELFVVTLKRHFWFKDSNISFFSPLSYNFIDYRIRHPINQTKHRFQRPGEEVTMSHSAFDMPNAEQESDSDKPMSDHEDDQMTQDSNYQNSTISLTN